MLRRLALLSVLLAATAGCESAAPANAEAATSEGDLTAKTGQPAPLPITAKDGGITGGHCAATFPSLKSQGWRHTTKATAATLMGAANHRLRDLILLPGQAAQVRGRFTYGAIDKDLEDETVELYLQKCPGWELIATQLTDSDGVAMFSLPSNLPPGDYRVRAVVRGDKTTADGMIAVWPKGVQVVVTDVDGTLTTSDWELFKDQLSGKAATMYTDGDKAIRSWATKGYRILYLTGRPQLYNRYTHNWLDAHNLPPGVVRLTDDVGDVVPNAQGVQVFKTDVLKGLLSSHSAQLRAGHGNATTDVGAYQAAGIANADLFIIGPNGGASGSTAVASYTKLLSKLAAYPDAKQPK